MVKIVRSEYSVENGCPIIYLFHRINGKRKIEKITNFSPYFYVPYDERYKLAGIEVDTKEHYSIHGEKVAKLYTLMPSDVSTFRDMYSKHYEADVLFPLRYLIDKVDVLEPCSPSVMFMDIETDNEGRVPDVHLAPEEIIAVTAYCNEVYTTFVYRQDLVPGTRSDLYEGCLHEILYFRDEVSMLESFLRYCVAEEPDMYTGWNLVNFDMPYIVNRMKRLGLKFEKLSPMNYVSEDDKGVIKVKGVAVVDLMALYKQSQSGQKTSYSLDAIGKEVLSRGKIGSSSNIKWMWAYNLEDLITYNTNDVYLCVHIDKKKQLLDFLDEMRRLCHCQFEDCMTITRMADTFILHMFHDRKVFPSKGQSNEETSYEGAIVETRAGGLHENVAVYDVKSLYPSIIVTANLSPESMRNSLDTDIKDSIRLGKFWVRQDIKGYLPEVVNYLFKERSRYKKLQAGETYGTEQYNIYKMRQESIKRLLNALYGQTAYPKSRLYDPRVAETITWMGRKTITWSRDLLLNKGYKVIYLDTDSLHVVFDEYDLEHMVRVMEMINQSYSEFTYKMGFMKHALDMQFEKVYKKVFYNKDTKKRYAGAICYKDGKPIDILDIWGFETKRSDASALTRRLLTTVFDMVLRQDKSKEEVMRYIGEEIDAVRRGKFSFEDIGIPKGISKEPTEYCKKNDDSKPLWEQPGIAANIRGALYTIHALGQELSSKPKLIYVAKMPEGYPSIDVVCFDEEKQLPAGIQIDTEKMLDKTIRAKLEPIFNGLNWKLGELLPWWKGKAPKEGVQQSFTFENN